MGPQQRPPQRGHLELWGLARLIQGTGQDLRRSLNDRNHALIAHPRRTDHAEYAEYTAFDAVRRGDHAACAERVESGLLADEQTHALGPRAALEQQQQVALALEGLEQLAQPL